MTNFSHSTEFPPAPQWMCDSWDEYRAAMAAPEWRDVLPPPLSLLLPVRGPRDSTVPRSPSGGQGQYRPSPPGYRDSTVPVSPLLSPHTVNHTTEVSQRDDTPRRQRNPTLASVAKQASKAGIEVTRYEIKPDGSVVIVAGKPEPAEPENPWLADLHKETKQ
jgi:hypothetical protein